MEMMKKISIALLATTLFVACSKDTVKQEASVKESENKITKDQTRIASEDVQSEPQPSIMIEEELNEMVTKTDHIRGKKMYSVQHLSNSMHFPIHHYPSSMNTEEYSSISENGFKSSVSEPLSTFSIDVDAASYSNTRRYLNTNSMPPKDAVRIEEMINYFSYEYETPKGNTPFSINQEIGLCPWNTKHQLVHIGIQGEKIESENLAASNLVFLIDVSGSMSSPNKLPLLKKSFKLLVNNLREQDKVAIVVYAGAAGLVLPSTSGAEKHKIIQALENFNAGGSTAGGAGIRLAYKIAKENFSLEGNNRVIIATDGDFNVGESRNGAMEALVEEKRKEGVFLTALGFGMGNYKDSKMEILADKGNGNYAYIDDILEANKVLVKEMGGTLHTIAKDVKLQVEFNPERVKAYRLVGYENRLLNKEDFNDDKKDAGELGAGHTVTALYELILADSDEEIPSVDPLKYQTEKLIKKNNSNELMTVKIRYKEPKEEKSQLVSEVVKANFNSKVSNNFNFSASVASFGMLLRKSEYNKEMNYQLIMKLANSSKGKDQNGYRSEFVRLVEKAFLLSKTINQ